MMYGAMNFPIKPILDEIEEIAALGFDYLEFSLVGSHMLKKSHRDLFSKFGQSLYLSVNQSLKDPDAFSSKTVAVLNLYFPGLFSHHSTRFYFAHEKNENKFFREGIPRVQEGILKLSEVL